LSLAVSSISGGWQSKGSLNRCNSFLRYLLDEARISFAGSDSLFICVVKLPVELVHYQSMTGVLVFCFKVQFNGVQINGHWKRLSPVGNCEAMSREYPDWISPVRAAEGKRIFSGTIPFLRMKRLAALLVDAQGKASFVAAFRSDIDKRVVIDLQVEAALPLVCQASLEVYNEQLKRRSNLVVIDNDGEQTEVPDHYEPIQTEHGRLAIVNLVEDELLLGLPQIPRKPGSRTVNYSTTGATHKEQLPQQGARKNPFAVLKDMLKSGGQD